MASTIPNQPIIFDESLDCHLVDSPIKMLAAYGDITQFQMELNPCDSDLSLIQNPEFNGSTNWSTTGGGWTIAGGLAFHVVGVAGSIYQAAPTPDGTLVRLTFDITNTSSTIPVVLTWGDYSNYLYTGSYELWIEASNANNLQFSANGSIGCSVRNLQMMSVNTDFQVNIVNDSGTTVDTLESSDGYFSFVNGYFTCSIDWETLAIPEDCYTIQVVDPCPCSQRGITALDLETSTFEWYVSGGWTITGGTATYNDSALATATLFNSICSGKEYDVTYTLSGMGGNEEFRVTLGSASGTTRTTDGTYTDTITANGNFIRLRGVSTSGTQTFDLTGLSIVETTPSSVLTSNTIKLQESFNCGTLQIYMCNDSDGLGFGFDSFRPMFRVEGSISRGSYPTIRESYEYSTGLKKTTYGRLRVARDLGLDLPPHLVDFMSLSPIIDHFYIGETEYFVEDDEFPSVSWNEAGHVGSFVLQISEKEQLVENRRLTSASKGCNISGNFVTVETGETLESESSDALLYG